MEQKKKKIKSLDLCARQPRRLPACGGLGGKKAISPRGGRNVLCHVTAHTITVAECRFKELEAKQKELEVERQRKKREKDLAKREQHEVLGKGGARPKLSFSLS